MKSVIAKLNHMFKMGALNLMDEILEDTGSDQQSSTGMSETSTIYHTISLQEVQDNSQSLLNYWEMEYRKLGNVCPHLIGMNDRN
jgi:hypothetical protein